MMEAMKMIRLQLVLLFCLMVSVSLWAKPGDLDSTFSGDGKLTFDLFGLTDTINAMAQQKDGKIVAVGQSYGGGFTYGVIIRLNTDGTTDPTFNGGGVVFTNLMDGARAVLIQSDGKIVVGGYTTKSGYSF